MQYKVKYGTIKSKYKKASQRNHHFDQTEIVANVKYIMQMQKSEKLFK